MTVAEAIRRLDEKKPNTLSQAQKREWLTKMDLDVLRLIHQVDTPLATYGDGDELLLPAPFADAYLYWLAAQIDLWNREFGGYNNFITLYNGELARYRAFWLRSHPQFRGGFTG